MAAAYNVFGNPKTLVKLCDSHDNLTPDSLLLLTSRS
jgi:hypothetical protein